MLRRIKDKIRKNRSSEIRKLKHSFLYQTFMQNWTYFRSKNKLKQILESYEKEKKKQLQFPKNVAIIFQGTKSYVKLFPNYYRNLKKYFLPGIEKTFFVLTDEIHFDFFRDKKDIIPLYQEHDNLVMLRAYEHMYKAREKLKKYDYIVWLDADMWLEEPLFQEEFFCHDKELFGVMQPNFLNGRGSFEDNKDSLAYVDRKKVNSEYIQACFWGGKSQEALRLVKELDRRIKKDLSGGFSAKLEDEAHLNKYRIENRNKFHLYPPTYAYPPNRRIMKQFTKKIFHGKNKKIDVLNN